jgi:hypothetical protein
MSDKTTSSVSLSSLILPSKAVKFDFPGYPGLEIELCYLSRQELLSIRKKCVTMKFDKRTRQPEEQLDEDRFMVEYCSAIIKGWEGFKHKYLEEFLLVDVSSLDPEESMPYTIDNVVTLMKNSSIFEEWVSSTLEDLENFTQNK